MKRPAQHHFRVSLASSVRARLTLWYLAMVAFIMCLFGGSLYVAQTILNADTAESRLEAQLFQDSQHFAQTYGQALLDSQAPKALRLNQSSQEIVLLLLARADTGQIKLNLQEVDLSDIALASVERLLPLVAICQVTLATGDLPEVLVRGDRQYLGQMLTNLIENGIKYTSGIGKRVSVELACEQERWGIVRVQDDGPGISEEFLPSLFERFYRVDKARSPRAVAGGGPAAKPPGEGSKPSNEEPGGSGLGLSIVQWIVQIHGGEIRVESTIGAGSLFEVHLPLLSRAEE